MATPVTAAEVVEAYRANALFDAHQDHPVCDYRLLIHEAKDAGEVMCERSAWRIHRDDHWWSAFGKKCGKEREEVRPTGAR